jgi:integrase|tara:strand:- start:1181 stop:2485 length:1305 start_codon:yes stop_codon:yes gene_type:complete
MTDRKNKHTFQQSLYDGESHIYKVKKSGDVYQFRMWIAAEGKHYRKSLRTKNYDEAFEKAKTLTKEIMASGISDKLVFSISVQQLIDDYVAYREHDIDMVTGISRKRWQTIKSQLKYFAIICGANTSLSSLNKDDLYEYSSIRNKIKKGAVQTIRMEKSTINACIKFGYRNKLIHFEYFDFKQLIIKGDMIERRGTFTDKEYRKLLDFLKRFTNIKNAHARIGNRNFKNTAVIETKEQAHLERLMIRDYIMILANTGLRVGEALQLTWGRVGNYEKHNVESEYIDGKKEQHLVEIEVLAKTSKVRKHRIFLARGGQYFERLNERQQHTNSDDLVFSMNGKADIHDMRKRKYWEELMEGVGITDWEDRKLSWYSLRHFFITQRVKANNNVVEIAQMCGTSVKHITDTYLHYSKQQSRTAALKSFKTNKDGTITAI